MITEQSMMGATGLALTIFNNTALFGPPLATSTVATPLATFSGLSPFSATLVGTLSVERGFRYNFTCHFGDAVLGYAHIDGHLVCQTGINGPRPPTPPSVRSSRYDTPSGRAHRAAAHRRGSPRPPACPARPVPGTGSAARFRK